jgi:prephenate dehydrogenase
MKVGILGLGLIGGSLALSLNKSSSCKILGWDKEEATNEEAKRRGITIASSPAELMESVEVIVLATPPSAMPNLIKETVLHIKKNTLISDVSSIKRYVIDSILPILPKNSYFIGAHPLSGYHKSGITYARDDLFLNKVCFFCYPKNSSSIPEYIKEKLIFIWRSVGSRIIEIDAKLHDKLLAMSSHLPQLLAYNLASYFFNYACGECKLDCKGECLIIGEGFKSMTRLAESDIKLWNQIFEKNKDFLLLALENWEKSFSGLKEKLKRGEELSFALLSPKNRID